MAYELLGESFDIHGGGLDLQFPHHENEIAQSRCAHPESSFARIWMHNEMLQVEGKKMSKSLGNFFTVRDLLDQGIPGEVIRFVLLGTHYGKPMDWTDEKRRIAERVLADWFFSLVQAHVTPSLIELYKKHGLWRADEEVVRALADDLNTHLAITRLHALANDGSREGIAAFAASLELLGFVDEWSVLPDLAKLGHSQVGEVDAAVAAKVNELMFARSEARARKDFAMADRIRASLVAAGVVVTDGATASWTPGPDFDPSKLRVDSDV